MNRQITNRLVKILIVGLAAVLLFVGLNWVYTVIIVRWAARQGTYATAKEGIIERANAYYEGSEKNEIQYAGPNSFDGNQLYVWYVIARIWAERKLGRSVGSPGKDYETLGGFFLQTKQGCKFQKACYRCI